MPSCERCHRRMPEKSSCRECGGKYCQYCCTLVKDQQVSGGWLTNPYPLAQFTVTRIITDTDSLFDGLPQAPTLADVLKAAAPPGYTHAPVFKASDGRCYTTEVRAGLREIPEPSTPVLCAKPEAPVIPCAGCGRPVHTCERDTAIDNDYRCSAHPYGLQLTDGNWVCSQACADIVMPA